MSAFPVEKKSIRGGHFGEHIKCYKNKKALLVQEIFPLHLPKEVD
jgi:hypothetical protein